MLGKVPAGVGQAGYYLTRDGYRQQFLDRLGFIPFPGTLNVLLEEPFSASAPVILIHGFSKGRESFAGCRCYRIRINGLDAVAIRPEKSSHPPELMEVIAPVNLRRALNLKDGDIVEVSTS
jgi:riboflavin kinase